MKKKYNVLIVGFGYWGPILSRNFQSHQNFNIRAICDSNSVNLTKAKNVYPHSKIYNSFNKAMENDDIDIVVVSSPTSTHYKIVKLALNKKKHVMCEKPLSLKLNEVKNLIKLSKKNKKFLFVDYPFIYSESVSYIKKIFKNKKLGKPLIYESIREKAPYRKDANVIWDLGIHDFSILQYLLNDLPLSSSIETNRTKIKFKSDFANINLKYKNNFSAFIKLNWSSPIKIRLIKIYFEKGLLIYDENEGIYKISVYKKSKQGYNLEMPQINKNETLNLFVSYIYNALNNKKINKFDFNFSLNITSAILKITKNV
jgi:predicted dehydrogenase